MHSKVNTTKFPDLKGLVDYGHSKGLKMGFYTGNCICGEGGVENANTTWANLSYIGDVKLAREAGFDGMKIDNCAGQSGASASASALLPCTCLSL